MKAKEKGIDPSTIQRNTGAGGGQTPKNKFNAFHLKNGGIPQGRDKRKRDDEDEGENGDGKKEKKASFESTMTTTTTTTTMRYRTFHC